TLEDVARYYGAVLPELHRVGSETRTRCFLQCGRTAEAGDRALAIQHDHPAKQWHCHQYGCGKGGNLLSLCDLLKPGASGSGLPPRASAYFRRRPFLSPEVCRKWRMGYLPRDTGEDKSGGTMRGKIVYAYQSEAGEVLTWFGRDPDFEDKHQTWRASDRTERE